MEKDDRLRLIMEELGGINIATNKLADIRADIQAISLCLITGKSQKLRDCIGKNIWIETSENGTACEGRIVSVDNHWVTIEWSPQSPAEDKTKHFTDIAIDRIEAFGLVENDGQTS